jgi:two-component system response regulator GlrR
MNRASKGVSGSGGSIDAHEELSKLNLIGSSASFQAVLQFVRRFAACDAPMLIAGETGTGKEIVARALHYSSPRRDRPFVPVNCGALPDNLFENELFGHARGAFTDAHLAQKGLIAQGQGGTVLLDEIDSLSPKGQVALLRFLQDRKYRPLGSEQIYTADVRVIAATNSDLWARAGRGQFREDLLFRLDVVSISLPALRDRPEDIFLLARHFLQRFSAAYGCRTPVLDRCTEEELLSYHWPGNVRELENVLHRAVLLAEHDGITTPLDLGRHGKGCTGTGARLPAQEFSGGLMTARRRITVDFERRYILWVLAQTGGNVSAAARHALTERRHFGRLIRRHGIDATEFRTVPTGPSVL